VMASRRRALPLHPPRAVTAWLPVTAIPTEMGPLTFARGTLRPGAARQTSRSTRSAPATTPPSRRPPAGAGQRRSEPYGIGASKLPLRAVLPRPARNRTVRPRRSAGHHVCGGRRPHPRRADHGQRHLSSSSRTEPGGLVASGQPGRGPQPDRAISPFP
jgi:hypothetical protein